MSNVFQNAKYVKAPNYSKEYSLYDPLPIFRREFTVNGDFKKAKITVQSPGFACYYINGKPITTNLFISAVSNYQKILWYNTYDVTKLLVKGVNTISVIAGNGFYNESLKSTWEYEKAPWRDGPKFILSLSIDGEEVLVSDESWKVSKEVSPIIYSHLRSGEYFDARKKNDDWKYNGYDDSLFTAVETDVETKSAKFILTKCQPVEEIESIKPVKILQNERGYLIDFGKNTSGYVKVRVKEKRDTVITMRYAEEIDDKNLPRYAYLFYKGAEEDPAFLDGTAENSFYPESPFQVNKLIASGEVDEFKPMFSYHGFRYLQVEGLTSMPNPDDFTAYFTHQKVKKIANFTSGDKVLNFIYTAGMRSTYSNLFWSLTDCPTREKFGWTNDAAASSEQTLINLDVKRLYEKWFTDLLADMRDDGSLPGIIPSNGWGDNWGPVCDNLLFELPYRVYEYSGDKKMLIKSIPYFNRYIKFLSAKRKQNHEFILGDWLGCGSSPLTPKEFVRDFFLIKAIRVTLFAYKLKGKTNVTLENKLKALEKEFISTYILDSGESTVDSQAGLSMLLSFNLCKDIEVLKKQLISRVEKDNYQLTCGMVGVQFLYDALTDAGRADLAYKIVTESTPGYKTWYDLGATTLWECWDGENKGSHNHQMFSNIIAWFYKGLLGINANVDYPAYERVDLRPCFIKKIRFVKGYVTTKKGKLYAEWKYKNKSFIYKVTVPNGITAIYDGKTLKSGVNEFVISDK